MEPQLHHNGWHGWRAYAGHALTPNLDETQGGAEGIVPKNGLSDHPGEPSAAPCTLAQPGYRVAAVLWWRWRGDQRRPHLTSQAGGS